MKRVLLAVLLVIIIAPTALATISNETCYNQCAAWKFYFKNDFCWGWFQEECVKDKEGVGETALSFVLDMSEGTAGIETIGTVFQCVEIINGCLAPILKTCKQNCAQNTADYAPNLDVIETSYGRNNPGIFYNEDTHKLQLVVTNDGLSYAKPVSVTVQAGSTLSHDKQISQWTTIFSGQTPGLVPMDANIQPEGSKNTWEQTIDWTATPNAYNEVRIIVDAENIVEESGEADNTYTEVINLLPTVADIHIDHISKVQNDVDLAQATVTAVLKNDGDEAGDYTLKIYKGSVAPENFVAQETGFLSGHSQKSQNFDFDLSNESGSTHGTTLSYYAVVEKDGAEIDRQWFYLTSYAGFITGHVVDAVGRPLEGTHVCTETQACADTNKDGRYSIRNLRLVQHDFTVTASHPSVDRQSTRHVTLAFNKTQFMQDGLEAYDVDFVLGSTPGQLTIDCAGATGQMDYFVSSADAAYSGTATLPTTLDNVMPGAYNVSIIQRGITTKKGAVTIAAGESKNLALDCAGVARGATDIPVTAPILAWNASVEGLPTSVAIAKDGKTIVVYARTPGKFDQGKLYSFDDSGRQKWMLPLPTSKGQDLTWVGVTDDGSRIMLCRVEEDTTRAHIYDDKGAELATADMGKQSAVYCALSPDGQYTYASGLRDGLLKQISGGDVTTRQGSAEGLYTQDADFFDESLKPNLVLASCKGGLCEYSFDRNVQRTFETKYPIVASQTAARDKTAVATKDAIDYYEGTSKKWTAPIDRYPVKLSISPGGGYVALLQDHTTDAFKVFADGKDITPAYKIYDTPFAFRFTNEGLYAVTGKTGLVKLYIFGKPEVKPGKETGPGTKDTGKPEKPSEAKQAPGLFSRFINWLKGLFSGSSSP